MHATLPYADLTSIGLGPILFQHFNLRQNVVLVRTHANTAASLFVSERALCWQLLAAPSYFCSNLPSTTIKQH